MTVVIMVVIAAIVVLVAFSGAAAWSVGGGWPAVVTMYAVVFALCGWLLNAVAASDVRSAMRRTDRQRKNGRPPTG